jgi:hypothetical protein
MPADTLRRSPGLVLLLGEAGNGLTFAPLASCAIMRAPEVIPHGETGPAQHTARTGPYSPSGSSDFRCMVALPRRLHLRLDATVSAVGRSCPRW